MIFLYRPTLTNLMHCCKYCNSDSHFLHLQLNIFDLFSFVFNGYPVEQFVFHFQDVSCDPFTTIANGDVQGNDYSVGKSLTIVCDSGYVISGSATVTCQSSTEWSEIPTCEREFSVTSHLL